MSLSKKHLRILHIFKRMNSWFGFKQIILMSLCFFFAGCSNDEDINGLRCIKGKVMNGQDAPISDVNLQLINKVGTSPYQGKITFTDQGGNYSFQDVTPADNYLLIATHPDYETDTTFVNIFSTTENECISENITLSLFPQAFDEFAEAFIFLGEWGRSKYYLSEFETTWPQANDICNRLQVHLVTITSQVENDFLTNALQGYETQNYWIGLTDAEDEGEFEWVSGELLVFTNWKPNEPNNLLGEEDVVEIAIRDSQSPANGQWNDQSSSDQLKFIVEREQ